jgi:hypothetical protein
MIEVVLMHYGCQYVCIATKPSGRSVNADIRLPTTWKIGSVLVISEQTAWELRIIRMGCTRQRVCGLNGDAEQE